jgi:hypothetical protein
MYWIIQIHIGGRTITRDLKRIALSLSVVPQFYGDTFE